VFEKDAAAADLKQIITSLHQEHPVALELKKQVHLTPYIVMF
jgi:hypothetical protein